jgi:hypothetical protein
MLLTALTFILVGLLGVLLNYIIIDLYNQYEKRIYGLVIVGEWGKFQIIMALIPYSMLLVLIVVRLLVRITLITNKILLYLEKRRSK